MPRRAPCKQSGETDPETGRPLCMHGVVMTLERSDGGDKWSCSERKRERGRNVDRKRRALGRGLVENMTLEQREHQRSRSRSKNARRLFVGHEYYGMVGFTDKERKEILNGTSN